MVGGKAKWSSKGWIINQLESEVVVLFEQVVIDLKHGPKVSVYRVGCDPWAVSGTGGGGHPGLLRAPSRQGDGSPRRALPVPSSHKHPTPLSGGAPSVAG